MSYITNRKRAEGLGSAKAGTQHFWHQRVTAIALLFLVPMFIFPFAYNLGDGYDAVRAAYAHPINAIVAIAFLATAWLHFFQGIQVVIEDYVHGRMELVLIIAMRLLAALFALVGVFAILKIALGA
ncbi:succinate dehydrogenase, hydrophobic membrane anchor protein [Maritimibacter fusiformis]|jgi:succinate dehydrogenase / fumarate reductase membrane anchor subunit|uniref:Succinate dehydrogenase hydrophobic membrane anchor subunit n=1 Tax=Maritimibacter fusiformis TaxID=2603819 RepID=A0A5D0RMP7_9RHOB|nr:succinate dehydrogenase, hydrophobic membrane anchor protein [Maritimibacter fusiformis]TYB82115.1 succinate dehydrogenase, hydrophobic membrane anchor protein [Maritimibacter fusiformis]